MIPHATQMRASRVLAVLTTLLFLFASLPFGHGLSPGWFVALLLLLISVLLKWGPRLLALGYARIVVLGAVGLFLTSLVNRSVELGEVVVVGIVIGVLLILFIVVSRSEALTATSACLRAVTIGAMGLFALSLNWSGHRALANMREGDFFVVDVPLLNRLVLPHPYDFYFVEYLIPCVLLVSLVCSVIGSGLYFWKRNSDLRTISNARFDPLAGSP